MIDKMPLQPSKFYRERVYPATLIARLTAARAGYIYDTGIVESGDKPGETRTIHGQELLDIIEDLKQKVAALPTPSPYKREDYF